MSYSTDPVRDAAEYYDAAHARRAALDAHDASLKRCFLLAASLGNMAAPAGFAPMVRDWEAGKERPNAKRTQTVGEVLVEAFDYSSGPQLTEVMGLLCAASMGQDIRAAARELLERAADKWAEHNVDEFEVEA